MLSAEGLKRGTQRVAEWRINHTKINADARKMHTCRRLRHGRTHSACNLLQQLRGGDYSTVGALLGKNLQVLPYHTHTFGRIEPLLASQPDMTRARNRRSPVLDANWHQRGGWRSGHISATAAARRGNRKSHTRPRFATRGAELCDDEVRASVCRAVTVVVRACLACVAAGRRSSSASTFLRLSHGRGQRTLCVSHGAAEATHHYQPGARGGAVACA